jgi:hypothetical protein
MNPKNTADLCFLRNTSISLDSISLVFSQIIDIRLLSREMGVHEFWQSMYLTGPKYDPNLFFAEISRHRELRIHDRQGAVHFNGIIGDASRFIVSKPDEAPPRLRTALYSSIGAVIDDCPIVPAVMNDGHKFCEVCQFIALDSTKRRHPLFEKIKQ